MEDLITVSSELDLEFYKLKGLADMIFVKDAGGSSSLEESDVVNGFSLVLQDIAGNIKNLSEQIIELNRKLPKVKE